MKLWQRYFFLDTLWMFLFTCGAFYLLFVMIDYSLHTKLFGHAHIPGLKTFVYYLAQFSKRATLLIPFSLLLASIKVLTTLTLRGETIALLSSGVPKRHLLRPLLWVAGLAILFLYINAQSLYPTAVRGIERFEERYFRGHKPDKKSMATIPLSDDSKLLFSSKGGRMRDVYWIRGPKEIVHMEELILGETSVGLGVDILSRADDGTLTLVKTVESTPLPELPLSSGKLPKPLAPPDELSLTQLIKHLPHNLASDYAAEIATSLHQKLALPLICLLVVIVPAPFCLSFSRQKPVFFIYALSIAAFLLLTTLMDAAAILGAHHALNPCWAIWTPLLFVFGLFGVSQVLSSRVWRFSPKPLLTNLPSPERP